VEAFFEFVRERYCILLKRRAAAEEGATTWGPPWTKDPVLQKYRFCNVFREDDKTTVWFRENVRGPLSEHPNVLMATIIFRWFNRITTGKVLLDHVLFADWNPSRARAVLKDLHPLITGAYVIRTAAGMTKLEGLIKYIDCMWAQRGELIAQVEACTTLEGACAILQSYEGLGSFMAYEIVTDLRHTYLLRDATDINTWANPGPGAARGLGLVLLGDAEEFRYDSSVDSAKLQDGMQHLLALSRLNYWPGGWPRWEMREVEHSLCEYAKYMGAKEGRKLKQRFSTGR